MEMLSEVFGIFSEGVGIISVVLSRGVPRIWEGGAKNFFFQIWEFACREAMRIVRGVRGHAPPEKIF